ncbi:MAG: hypothetical protein ACLFNA_03995, partial [Halochromatium sp.]
MKETRNPKTHRVASLTKLRGALLAGAALALTAGCNGNDMGTGSLEEQEFEQPEQPAWQQGQQGQQGQQESMQQQAPGMQQQSPEMQQQ